MSDSNHNAKVRLHDRLAWQLTRRIRSGDWKAGEKLPSIRDLAAEYHIAPVTVGNAIRQLQESGLIVCRPNSGSYVNSVDALRASKGFQPIDDMLLSKNPPPQSGKTAHFLFHLDSLKLFTGSFYPEMFCLMQEEAEAVGWNLRIGNTDQMDLLSTILNTPATCAGIIYMPDCGFPYDLAWPELTVPKVLFSLGEKSMDSNYVTPNNYRGGYLAAKNLLKITPHIVAIADDFAGNDVFRYKLFENRYSGIADYCKLANHVEPELWSQKNPEMIARRLSELLKLPRNERPAIVLLGSWPYEDFEEFCNNIPESIRVSDEFDVAIFLDFDDTKLPHYHTITFDRRLFCREVIHLLMRSGTISDGLPLTIKIPMNFQARTDKKR